MKVLVISDRLNIHEEGELLKAPSGNLRFPFVVRLDDRGDLTINVRSDEIDSPVPCP